MTSPEHTPPPTPTPAEATPTPAEATPTPAEAVPAHGTLAAQIARNEFVSRPDVRVLLNHPMLLPARELAREVVRENGIKTLLSAGAGTGHEVIDIAVPPTSIHRIHLVEKNFELDDRGDKAVERVSSALTNPDLQILKSASDITALPADIMDSLREQPSLIFSAITWHDQTLRGKLCFLRQVVETDSMVIIHDPVMPEGLGPNRHSRTFPRPIEDRPKVAWLENFYQAWILSARNAGRADIPMEDTDARAEFARQMDHYEQDRIWNNAYQTALFQQGEWFETVNTTIAIADRAGLELAQDPVIGSVGMMGTFVFKPKK